MSDLQLTAHSPQPSQYRGRFAPSPTGPLHFGSLIAAAGSYLQAKHQQGAWLVRIEDLDPPRTVPGAADAILQTLHAYGFEWDGPVLFQSTRSDAYQSALQRLVSRDLCYPCSCTRSELLALTGQTASQGDELTYPGRCASGPVRTTGLHAWRLRTTSDAFCFTDLLQGRQCVNLHDSIGDFVIKRRDGWFAYQLAVVVDDAEQHISEVVRGYDLLLNTPRQIALQRALRLTTPRYAHLPLAVDSAGHKLSKSNAAPALTGEHAARTLWMALCFLQQAPPPELQLQSLPEIWHWAISHWNIDALRGLVQLPVGA